MGAIIIVTLKHVVIVLRANNHGEGGTLSLMALAHRAPGDKSSVVAILGMTRLAVATVLLLTMITWRRGTELLGQSSIREQLLPADHLPMLEQKVTGRVQGTATFLTSHPDAVPTALMHNIKHNKILHEHNIIVCIDTADSPRVDEGDRGKAKIISPIFSVVRLKFGFMEEPDVPRAFMRRRLGLDLDPMLTSYFLSRRALRPSARSLMPVWQDRYFIWLAGHSSDASHYSRFRQIV